MNRIAGDQQNLVVPSFRAESETHRTAEAISQWLKGEGEMARRIREFDWSQTPIGPARDLVARPADGRQLMLANRFPMILWWGPQFVQFYNDPYRPIPGSKHPRSLGQPASECWSEIWHVIGPLIETPFHGGPATWDDDIFLEINRHGFVEETPLHHRLQPGAGRDGRPAASAACWRPSTRSPARSWATGAWWCCATWGRDRPRPGRPKRRARSPPRRWRSTRRTSRLRCCI